MSSQTNAQGRNFEQERRRHSGDLSHQRSVLDAKQRDGIERQFVLFPYLQSFSINYR